MQTIASRGAIIGQRVTARPSGKTASKSATRQPIKVNAVHTNQTGQGIMVDPDQYDPDANTGRGSGFVARAAGQQVMSSGGAFAPAGVRGGPSVYLVRTQHLHTRLVRVPGTYATPPPPRICEHRV